MILALTGDDNCREMIEQAVQGESGECLVLGEEDTLLAALQESTPDALFLDASCSAADVPGFIQKLKQNPATRKIPIVAFGNSLRADLLQDARELGADLVLPKAAFREQLQGLIRHYSKRQ